MRLRTFPLHNDDPGAGGGGAAPASTAAPVASPAPSSAPVASPAPSPGPTPAPSPDPNESLLAKPGATPAPSPAPGADELAWLPEKYRVLDADGKLDLAASSKKLGEGYGALSKRMGTGDAPPEKPEAYTFTPPEQFKDVPLDEGLTNSFRERAHAAGLTQKQYEFVMSEYFGMVPQVLDGAASFSATQAKEQLSKVWATQAELDAGLSAANKALAAAPEGIRDQLHERFGRDPLFIQFAASFGKEMREDNLPGNGGNLQPQDVQALIASQAYRDPKHPEHAVVSEKVRQHFMKATNNQPVFG